MKLITASLTSTILAAGLVGSVAAYRSQAGEVDHVETTTEEVSVRDDAPQPARTTVRWAPCPDGSQLEKGVCVTDVTRTVVIPAASTAAPARDEDGGGESRDDDRGEDQDDHEDDDHDHDEDDDHEDEDHEDDDHDEDDDDD